MHRLGELYGETNRLELGIGVLRQTVEIRTGIVRDSPRSGIERARLGNDLIALGDLEDRAGHVAAAARTWEQALTAIEQAVRDHPAQTLFRQALAEINELLGRLAVRGKSDPEVALRHLETARQIHESLLLASSDEGEMVFNLEKTYVDMFYHHVVFGHPELGLAVFDQAQKTFEETNRAAPGKPPDHSSLLAHIRTWRGGALLFLDRPEDAAREYDVATKFVRTALTDTWLSSHRALADGRLAVARGEVARARAIALEIAPPPSKNRYELIYGAAALLAACATATDPVRNPADHEQLTTQSLDILRQARDTHALSPLAMRSILGVDPAFAAIRKTKSYEQFLSELLRGTESSPK